MRKIPTLFKRDPENMARVLNEVNPGCEWVLAGEGRPTRKYDGTCLLLDADGSWWARREVKPGKRPPPNFRAEETDPNTGKTVGWEPIEQSSFFKAFSSMTPADRYMPSGTYELCGPKVNGNPEGYEHHVLVPHGCYSPLFPDHRIPRDFDGLKALLTSDGFTFEGVVWHHEDGRMVKIKRRDFGRS